MRAAFMVVAVLAAVAWTVHSALVCTGDVPEDKIEYIPHPCNCSTYYVCLGTEPIPMPCPRGLHWNQRKEQCDFPNKAKCKKQQGCPANI